MPPLYHLARYKAVPVTMLSISFVPKTKHMQQSFIEKKCFVLI